MSYQIIQEIEKEEARCGTCQSGVDELYHPLRECGMHTLYERQAEEENVLFEDTRETQFYSFPASSPDFSTDASPQQMGDFLSRPTLIKTISWVPAGVSDDDFDPWSLFLNTTEIKKKLDNFAYFRGNMHIKVVVNASPFYYGAMLINYTPLPLVVQAIDNTNVTALIPQSQKPHIWIDLRENMGGEMILPFVFHQNYVRLTEASQVSVLGRLRNITYVGLASANGATVTGVTVKVYAWMEDVELTANTTTLALQAKKEKVDEYGNGPISRPATALAHWASYLTNVPVIGTYAKATQIGASAVSSVAGLFGWSKVPVIENVKPVKPSFFHDLASAHLSEPTSKYTLDPKAELSIDPRIFGPSTGEDELAISNIVQKDSYLFSCIWGTNDAPDTILGSLNGTPDLIGYGSPTDTVYQVGFTPMSYISQMFNAWRGDIIVTIKVVCSQYHRGRLRVHWDPLVPTSTSDITNRTLTKLIDIGETTEIEFRIPYVNHAMWSKTTTTAMNKRWSVSGDVAPITGFHNGTLTVRVLNNLSAPIDTAPVTILYFVRGAENLEFADPRSLNDHFQPFAVQALVEDVEDDMQQKSSPLNDRYLINYGEAIPSLRLVLQRSCLSAMVPLHNLNGFAAGAMLAKVTMRQTRFPPSPGYDPKAYTAANGVVVPGSLFKYNFVHHTPLTWLTPMFVGRRGSIQWHYHINDSTTAISHLTCHRNTGYTVISDNSGDLNGSFTVLISGAAVTRNVAHLNLQNSVDGNIGGIVLTNARVNPSVAVEMPMMSRTRFQFTRPADHLVGTTEDNSSTDYYTLEFLTKPSADSLASSVISKFCNAGTDFSLYMFLCAPHMYYCAAAGSATT